LQLLPYFAALFTTHSRKTHANNAKPLSASGRVNQTGLSTPSWARPRIFYRFFHIFTFVISGIKREHCTRVCTHVLALPLSFTGSLHRICTRWRHLHTMASIAKLNSGNWRAQVRRKGRYASQSFRQQKDAQEWRWKSSAASTKVSQSSLGQKQKQKLLAISSGCTSLIC